MTLQKRLRTNKEYWQSAPWLDCPTQTLFAVPLLTSSPAPQQLAATLLSVSTTHTIAAYFNQLPSRDNFVIPRGVNGFSRKCYCPGKTWFDTFSLHAIAFP